LAEGSLSRTEESRSVGRIAARAERLLFQLVRWIVILLMAGITLVVFAQVVFRYALDWPLAWTEEVGRFGLIWIGFFGAAALTAMREHIAVTMVPDAVGRRPQLVLRILTDVIVLGILLIMLRGGLDIVSNEWAQRAPATFMPMGYVYLVIPVSSFLMMFWVLADLVRSLLPARAKDPA
jgi:TRAP-type C4-dicarboxylate transport system permease small subunit